MTFMKEYLLIFLGGGVGSVLRYSLAGSITRMPGLQLWGMPWGTLVCNAMASLVLGFLAAFATRGMPHAAWLLLAVGLCGGWSTFSTFSMECVLLFREGKPAAGAAYIALSLLLSVGAFWLPFATMKNGA